MLHPAHRVVLASLLLSAPLALAADLSPEKVAQIRRDQQAAMERVEKAAGNKKPSEMSNEERRGLIEARAAAQQQVLDKHGVDAREYTNYTLRMGKEERAQTEAAEKKLEAQAKAAAEKKAEAAKKAGTGEVQVQQGFSDQNPVDLEESKDAPPKVEYIEQPAAQ